MLNYVIERKPPSFPARASQTITQCMGPHYALELARQLSKRNRKGSYSVYAVENSLLLRGCTFKAGQLVAIGQPGENPYAWDWGEISLS